MNADLDISELRIKTNKRSTLIPSQILLDSDFSRLMGYYPAEGCVSEGRVFFSFGFHEDILINDVKNILNNYGINYSENIGF